MKKKKKILKITTIMSSFTYYYVKIEPLIVTKIHFSTFVVSEIVHKGSEKWTPHKIGTKSQYFVVIKNVTRL